MTATNLRLALQIQADLNQARQAVRNLGTDLSNTSENASDATQELEHALDSAIREIQRLSGATDMQDGIDELRQYERELDNVSDATNEASESNQILENSVRSLAPHLMALAGLSGGFATIAVDTLNKAIELDRLASFSTTGVEQLQYYAAGAKSAGVEVDSLAQIFKDARDKVGEFSAEGGGELQGFFENIAPKVGVTAEQFKKLTGPEIMQLYVNTLREAGVSENEMIMHMEKIADDATVLLPLFEKNGAGFKKYGDNAKNAGAILDKDFIEKAKIAKGALGDFQNKVTGVSYKLIANAAPAIVFVAQNLDILAKAGLIVASVWMGKVVSSITLTTIAFIQQRIAAIASAIALVRVNGVAIATTAAMRGLFTISNLLTAAGGLIGLAVAIAGVAASFLLMNDNNVEAVEGLEEQKKTISALAEEYKKLDEVQQRIAVRDATKKQDELTLAYKSQQSQLASLIEMGTRSSDVSEEQRQKAVKLVEQYKAGKLSANQLATEYQKLNTVKATFRNRADEVAGAINKAKSEMERQNLIVDVYTGKASSAAIATYDLNNSIEDTGTKAKGSAEQVALLTKAHKELIQSAQNSTFELQYEIGQRKAGVSPELASANAKSLSQLNADPNATQTYFRAPDDVAQANAQLIEAQKELNAESEKDKKNEEAKAKLKEQQLKTAITQKAISASTNEQTKNMLMVYQGFMKTGISDSLARYLTAEVGREGDFLSKNLFGSHKDKNNGETNVGIISYQKTRAKELISNLNSKGLLDNSGGIKRNQDSIDAQTAFAVNEFLNKNEYAQSKNAALSGKSYKALQQISGHNFIGWDVKGSKLSDKAVSDAIARMDGYKSQLDKMLGNDPSALLGDFSKLTSMQTDFAKIEEQQENTRISIRESLWKEEEKVYEEHVKKLADIEKAGFSGTEKNELIAKENQRYEDVISKRPEILKRVQDSLQSVQQDFLKSSGRGLEADLQGAEDKYKQLQSDIARLMMNETDPVQQKQYQSMLVRLDFIIDKEQLTMQFNDAMQKLEQLQTLRQQKQDTLKLQFESGQVTQPQYAEGLKSIDAEMKPQLLGLADVARQFAEQLDDAFSIEKVNNFVAGLNQVDTNFKKFLPTAEQLNEQIAGGLTDSIMAWADGTKSASDAFRQFASDFLRQIAQMILKQMLFNAISQMGGASSGGAGGMIAGVLSSAFGGKGFMDGGHTGFGARDEVAGFVHKDEWVITKPRTNEPGAKQFLSYFEKYGMQGLNKFKGYMDGGLVGAPNVSLPNISTKVADPAAMIANSTSFSANQNFYLVDDPARILDVLKSGASQENLVVMMSRDPAKFKSALKL